MKTSQYILLSFFGFIITAILVLYIDSKDAYTLKQEGNPKGYNSSLNRKSIPPKSLKSFSVIVAELDANLQIESDSVNSMSAVLFKKDTVFNLPEYKILNDTLYVSKGNYVAPTIIKCKSVKSIVGKKESSIYLNNLKSDSLFITLNNSKLNGKLENKLIDYIDVDVKNKSNLSLNVSKSNVSLTKLNMNNSKVYLYRSNLFKTLNAKLVNKADLHIGKIEKLIIECDASSRYQAMGN
ncbi:hypothetical protein [Thalassobellus sediminis]|uniref:hypothetical protein n=1 Tax=Thalassobellus sediminis TaxID=3367753 RepID=UPI0037AD64B6